VSDHVIVNFDFVTVPVLLEEEPDAVPTYSVLGLDGLNEPTNIGRLDVQGREGLLSFLLNVDHDPFIGWRENSWPFR